jgi:CRP/FNR family transcriptional regulator, cyclic AMP receptor protein
VRTIDEILQEVPLFQGLSDDALALIAGCGRNVGFEEDEALFAEGDPADIFYVVRSGTVALEIFVPTRGAVTIDTIVEGDVVGWSWLFPPYRWHFDARAGTDVRATAFDGACLRGKCADDPRFGYDLMTRFAQVMVERLQSTRIRLLDVYGYAAAR